MRPQYLLTFLFAASLWSNNAQVVRCQEYRKGQYVSQTSLFGVTYTPFAANEESFCIPPTRVEEDLLIIKGIADHVRTYNLASCPKNIEIILKFCEENDMRVILGLYLSGDLEFNAEEMGALKRLVGRYGQIVDAIVVGNETLFAKTLKLRQLLGYLRRAKAIVKDSKFQIPVTTAEVWPVYESSIGKFLVNATDFVCMNMQPFWEGWDIVCPKKTDYLCASAGSYVHRKAAGLEKLFGKPVWVCETGWPTKGERCCENRTHARDGYLAGPSIANATTFINEVVKFGRKAKRPTYIRAIFDEYWKRIWAPCGTCEGLSTLLEDPKCNSCEVDYHFGMFHFNRLSKKGLKLPKAP